MTSKHYKSTYVRLLNELPHWKQLAIKEDSAAGKWSGILTDFIKNVIITAESDYEKELVESVKDRPLVSELKSAKKPKKKSKSIDKL